jgi:hypothetical protein
MDLEELPIASMSPGSYPRFSVRKPLVDLVEFGPVTFPSYPGATAGVRSADASEIAPSDADEQPDAELLRQKAARQAPGVHTGRTQWLSWRSSADTFGRHRSRAASAWSSGPSWATHMKRWWPCRVGSPPSPGRSRPPPPGAQDGELPAGILVRAGPDPRRSARGAGGAAVRLRHALGFRPGGGG